MLRRALRSNWLYLVIALVLLGMFGGVWREMYHMGPQPSVLSYDLNLIAAVCGILSFGIQCVVWFANIVRWIGGRRTKSA